jgi:hypothetical protein
MCAGCKQKQKINETMQYKVIPFVASLDQKNQFSSQHVAEQLEKIIVQHNADGWTYVRLESVTTFVAGDAGGCFRSGKPAYNTARQVIVFEKN